MDEFLAKGKRGEVFLREERGKKVLVKVKNPKSDVDTIANEAKYNTLLNTKGIGPAFISYDKGKGELVREYVEGLEFRKWLLDAEKEAARHVLLTILEQCHVMDELGINKLEMTRPWKHIIVKENGEPVLIDFERCAETPNPKNVTQFCQFLTGSNLTAKLAEKGMQIESSKLLALAKKYKHNIKNNKKKENISIFQLMQEVVQHA